MNRRALMVLYPLLAVMLCACLALFLLAPPQRLTQTDSQYLSASLRAQTLTGCDWRAVYAALRAEKLTPNYAAALGILEARSGQESTQWLRERYGLFRSISALRDYYSQHKANILLTYSFPLSPKSGYEYVDGWGEKRTYGGERQHEGIDIMCGTGTPIYAVCDGKITHMGWNKLGGWRIGITDRNRVYYYYAHLSRYAPELHKGDTVQQGQLIGYAGSSGYGSEGQENKFPPHLHFGIYDGNKAVNPYPFLEYWEQVPDKVRRASA